MKGPSPVVIFRDSSICHDKKYTKIGILKRTSKGQIMILLIIIHS